MKDFLILKENFGTPPLRNTRQIRSILRRFYPKLKANFRWFIQSQRATPHNEKETVCVPRKLSKSHDGFCFLFQWKGRSFHHTLTSGLDDYPRGNYPNSYEVHVDLMCWMVFMCRSLKKMSNFLGISERSFNYEKMSHAIIASMQSNSFDSKSGLFFDRSLDENGEFVFVKHIGYINLFPMLFKIIQPDSAEFKACFKLLKEDLWSPYGIMSMSRNDSFYGKGDNYWTGPIWININYMVLAALHTHYIPHTRDLQLKQEITLFYQRLREALITNMSQQFKRTGFVWEQYNQDTGAGQRSHPFTGWSSLIVLIMSEKYD